jgi:hypothetical protein
MGFNSAFKKLTPIKFIACEHNEETQKTPGSRLEPISDRPIQILQRSYSAKVPQNRIADKTKQGQSLKLYSGKIQFNP